MATVIGMDSHNSLVSSISDQVKQFKETNTAFKIYHGSTNSTRNSNKDPKKIIDTSRLNHVLAVDRDRKVALVEPNVPMDALVDATLKHNLLPPVVPEFPGITVGGSYNGTAGESSSFKHGFFDRCINSVEFVLADGRILTCTPTEHADLFYGAAGAFGSLGVTTLFEIQLEPAPGFVEVTYLPVHSSSEAIALIQSMTKESVDYIDGILFSTTSGAVMVGRATNEQKYPLQRFSRNYDPWFYLHAQRQVTRPRNHQHQKPHASKTPSATSSASTTPPTAPHGAIDLVPVRDYIFRYDRGAFWMGTHGFPLFAMPFNRLTRLLLDPIMHTRKLYEAMHHSGHASLFIIQDLILPVAAADDFIAHVDRALGIWPLWLCPIRADTPAPLHAPRTPTPLLLNVGVWGPGRTPYSPADADRFRSDNHDIESRVADCGGRKWLYAQTFYDEDEFWAVNDREAHRALRSAYGAEGLPDLFDKVRGGGGCTRTKRLRAVLKTLAGREHLLKR